jgi:hydrogenase maturation protease
MTRHALVIGYGNTLRSDDAFGPQVARQLQNVIDKERVRVLERHCLTPEVAKDLADVDVAIFIDATMEGAVGQLNCRRIECPEARLTTMAHTSEPADLLALAVDLYARAPRSYLISVRGESFELQPDRLSESVQSAVPAAAKMIESILAQELNDGPRRATPANA